MADETYRGFHAGKYGPQGEIDIPYDPKFGATTGKTASPEKKEKKKEKEDPEEKKRKDDDEFMNSDQGGESSSWFSGAGE